MADWTVTYTTRVALVAPSFVDDTGDAQTWTQNVGITPLTVPAASGNPIPTYAAVGTLAGRHLIQYHYAGFVRHTDGGRQRGTITIRATNSEGMADWTVTYSTLAPPQTIPARPTGLGATATFEIVSLTWDDPADPSITSYQILRRDLTGGGTLGVHIDMAPVGTSYDDSTNVSPDNDYRYRIRARNGQGLSIQSATADVTTGSVPLVAPTFADDTGDAQAWTQNVGITPLTVPAAIR